MAKEYGSVIDLALARVDRMHQAGIPVTEVKDDPRDHQDERRLGLEWERRNSDQDD